MQRRQAIHRLGALGTLTTMGHSAWAQQDFPTRPLRMVVPFGAGSTTDIVTRTIAEAIGRALGQQVVVENRAGAGGNIGSDLVAKAPADGHTLLMGTVGTHGINPTLFRRLPYDVSRDFDPVAFVGYTPTLLVVAANSPWKNLADLKEAASTGSGVTFASAGNGTSGHLAAELVHARVGGKMVHVPYKEAGQALTDVISGQTHFMFYHPAAVMPHVRAGRLRALGASSARRAAAAPEVPTIAEQIRADFDLVAWFMLYTTGGTPMPILAKLREVASQVMGTADMVGKMALHGVELRAMGVAELTAFGRTEIGKWAELVKHSGAQVD
jgi:tripartite-type tricarboxylate transporter receptor subunit TctC